MSPHAFIEGSDNKSILVVVDHSRDFRYDIVFGSMLSFHVGFYDKQYKIVFGWFAFLSFTWISTLTVHLRTWKAIYRSVRSKQTVCIFIDVILIVYLFVRFHRTRRLTPTDSIALSGDRRPCLYPSKDIVSIYFQINSRKTLPTVALLL